MITTINEFRKILESSVESIENINHYDYSKLNIDIDNTWQYSKQFPTLIDKLSKIGYNIIKKDYCNSVILGTKLKQDILFYHGSNTVTKILKPKKPLILLDSRPILHLGDSTQAKTWGKYLYEVIVPSGTEIFQGPDGFNHIMVFIPLKVYSINILPGWENYEDENYETVKNQLKAQSTKI